MAEVGQLLHADEAVNSSRSVDLREWIEAEWLEWALRELGFAFGEFREMASAGTLVRRKKSAMVSLGEIEKHAIALTTAMRALSPASKWALHRVMYVEQRLPGDEIDADFGRWVRNQLIFCEDVLEPLGRAAREARKELVERRGKGHPVKTTGSPRDQLIRRIAMIYSTAAKPGSRRRGEPPAETFIRELLRHEGIEAPDNLARILRGNTSKKSLTKAISSS